MESQSLLIQRSYSYTPKTILVGDWPSPGRNPFLFRGPIPTAVRRDNFFIVNSRNPFLFRGPIPT